MGATRARNVKDDAAGAVRREAHQPPSGITCKAATRKRSSLRPVLPERSA